METIDPGIMQAANDLFNKHSSASAPPCEIACNNCGRCTITNNKIDFMGNIFDLSPFPEEEQEAITTMFRALKFEEKVKNWTLPKDSGDFTIIHEGIVIKGTLAKSGDTSFSIIRMGEAGGTEPAPQTTQTPKAVAETNVAKQVQKPVTTAPTAVEAMHDTQPAYAPEPHAGKEIPGMNAAAAEISPAANAREETIPDNETHVSDEPEAVVIQTTEKAAPAREASSPMHQEQPPEENPLLEVIRQWVADDEPIEWSVSEQTENTSETIPVAQARIDTITRKTEPSVPQQFPEPTDIALERVVRIAETHREAKLALFRFISALVEAGHPENEKASDEPQSTEKGTQRENVAFVVDLPDQQTGVIRQFLIAAQARLADMSGVFHFDSRNNTQESQQMHEERFILDDGQNESPVVLITYDKRPAKIITTAPTIRIITNRLRRHLTQETRGADEKMETAPEEMQQDPAVTPKKTDDVCILWLCYLAIVTLLLGDLSHTISTGHLPSPDDEHEAEKSVCCRPHGGI